MRSYSVVNAAQKCLISLSGSDPPWILVGGSSVNAVQVCTQWWWSEQELKTKCRLVGRYGMEPDVAAKGRSKPI